MDHFIYFSEKLRSTDAFLVFGIVPHDAIDERRTYEKLEYTNNAQK